MPKKVVNLVREYQLLKLDTVFAQMRIELGVLLARENALPREQGERLRELAGADPVWVSRVRELH